MPSKLDKSDLQHYKPQGRVVIVRTHNRPRMFVEVLIEVELLLVDLKYRLNSLLGDLYSVELVNDITSRDRLYGSLDMMRCGSSNLFRRLLRIERSRMNLGIG